MSLPARNDDGYYDLPSVTIYLDPAAQRPAPTIDFLRGAWIDAEIAAHETLDEYRAGDCSRRDVILMIRRYRVAREAFFAAHRRLRATRPIAAFQVAA